MVPLLAPLLCGSLVAAMNADTARAAPAGEGRGWFFYESPPLAPPPASLPEATDNGSPALLSTRWLRANLERYKEAAIDEPTPDNIRLYLHLQRYALDRAEGFAAATQLAVMRDPRLDEAQRGPISGSQHAVAEPETQVQRRRVIADLAAVTGLWFFYRSDCPYCRQQAIALSAFAERHGMPILPISIDGAALDGGAFPDFVVDRGQAAALDVTTTPTLYLMHADGQVLRLAQGLQTLPELEERVLMLGREAGWIGAEDYLAARGRRDGGDDAATADVDRRAFLLELLARAAPPAGPVRPEQRP